MALRFIGEVGVYFPDRDAIKIVALDGASPIDCYVTRSALEAVGCTWADTAESLVARFQQNRITIELAAMIKHRRSTSIGGLLVIEAMDLDGLEVDGASRDGARASSAPVSQH